MSEKFLSNINRPPLLLRALCWVGHRLPPFWRISGIGNRLLKPIWRFFGNADSYILRIWDGVFMRVDPLEVVGGNLAFIPQLYDRWERQFIKANLPVDGVFVDVGSNIGAYSLWAASCLGARGKVLALDADPFNFSILEENVNINNSSNHCSILCRLGGVADETCTLRFFHNETGNRGAHSFVVESSEFVEVHCKPLIDILKDTSIEKVDFMKLDIEGFEEKVLQNFFKNTPFDSPLRPNYLLVEIKGGPVVEIGSQLSLKNLILSNGYEMLVDRSNTLFRRHV